MNKMPKRAVFLDFDGVLFDTVKEAYCVSMVALDKAADISGVNLDSPHFQVFRELRFLVGSAWSYYYLMPLVDEKLKDPSLDAEEAFRNAIQNQSPAWHCVFEEKFFEARRIFRETEHDVWLSLIAPLGLVEGLRDLIEENAEKFFLITTRDRGSVLNILNAFQVGFWEENVLGNEEYAAYSSKLNIIQRLTRDRKIEESLFVDDFEQHLIACNTIDNLIPIQALWGYVAPEIKEDNSACVLQDIKNFIQGKNVRTRN